ncbi:glucosaminidase domain-containing protein [Candidatus Woesearchaeota archaeon]|nr:glucosaminidase domain-containing protein [Candidatus Woesearchaeota archaeon]
MVRWPFSRKRYKKLEDVPEAVLARAMDEAGIEDKARSRLKNQAAQAATEAEEASINQRMEELRNKQASGKGGSLINVTSILKPASKTSYFFWVAIVLIILLILWYFNIWKASFYYAGLIIWVGFIFWGFYLGFKPDQKDRGTPIAVAAVLFIWLLDMNPVIGSFLGQPYGGFDVGLFQLATAVAWTLPAFMASGISFAFLYINMVFNIIKREYVRFLLVFFFILITNSLMAIYFPRFYGINIPIPYGNMIFLFLVVAGFMGAMILNGKNFGLKIIREVPGFFTYLFMIFVFCFFWFNSGWMSTPRAWLHAVYIILFGFLYIVPREKENPVLWHILIPSLLIIDFFGYGLLINTFEYEWVKFIPTLVLFVLTYCYVKTENAYALTSFIVLITVILVLSIQAYGFESGSGLPFKQRTGADLKDFLGTLGDKLREGVESRLDIATAGLYRGSVEKNRYESLGVYFGNIRAADPRFYTDEPITVWGTIRSKTYKDAVIINFSCYRWKDNKRIRADQIIPNIMFPIFTLEEVDTQCTFLPRPKDDPLEAKPGPNIVTFSAEYNFATDAYLKAYFIDRERFRANAREGVDSLTQFGIKDKNPVAVFTNGPVEIGMGTISPITVSDGYAVKPSISITLTNRKEIQDKDKKIISRWDGKIKNITELVLLVPPGIELSSINPDNPDLNPCKAPKDSPARLSCPCSMPFEPYDINKCYTSCTSKVLEPCNKACENSNPKEDPKRACMNECVTAFDRCNEECKFLFEPEESVKGQYKGYALDIGSLDFRDLNKDIDKHRSFVCRFDPSPEVLGDTPITTRYFRVRARYNYVVENSVTVNVEQPPAGVASPTLTYDFDTGLYEEYIVPPTPYTGPLTNIDNYFKSKGSILEGTGQCIKDVETETRVPALVILSVANLESDKSGGQWTSLSGLARLSNALFGIKCTTDYINKYCTFADKRLCCKGYSKTTKDIIYEPSAPNVYRAYQNYCESFRDFGRLISTETRYSKAMLYTNNPEQMIREIREAKYATDTNWANLVIGRMRTIKTDMDRIGTVVT